MITKRITTEAILQLNANIIAFLHSEPAADLAAVADQKMNLTNITLVINAQLLPSATRLLEAAGRDGFVVVAAPHTVEGDVMVFLQRTHEYISTALWKIRYPPIKEN